MLKKTSYFHVFFWDRSSFLFRLRNKIILSGKRNIFFLDNTRKIIFQCNFFEKTIFSKYLEKENMVFRAVSTPNHKICCAVKHLYLPKRLRYQLLASKDLYIQTKLRNKFLKMLFQKTIRPSVEYWPLNITTYNAHKYPSYKLLPEKSCPDW